MAHPARFVAFLAVVSVTLILASCGPAVAVVPEGLVVSPNDAATLILSSFCETFTVDDRAVKPSALHMAQYFNVAIPAGRRTITAAATRETRCDEQVGGLGTRLSFDAVAGHSYMREIVPRVWVTPSGIITVTTQLCLSDRIPGDTLGGSQRPPSYLRGYGGLGIPRDTICSFPQPNVNAQTAVLTFENEGVFVVRIDRDSAAIGGVDGARMALSPGPHALVAIYNRLEARWDPVSRRSLVTAHITGDNCRLAFVAEAGHNYVLRARVSEIRGAKSWTPLIWDTQTQTEAQGTSASCDSPVRR